MLSISFEKGMAFRYNTGQAVTRGYGRLLHISLGYVIEEPLS